MKYLLYILVCVGLPSCQSRAVKEIPLPPPNKVLEIAIKIREKCGTDTNCVIETARKDFEDGKYRIFIKGMGEANSRSDYNSICLEVKRRIDVIGTGCMGISDTVENYYNTTMIRLLKSKYGEDYFDSCYTAADSLAKDYRKKQHY